MNVLSQKIVQLIEQARVQVAKAADLAMIYAYYNVGKLIIENLQEGKKRAKYGDNILKQLSDDLTKHFGRGYSVQNLERMRNFFTVYSKSSNELRESDVYQKSSNELRKFDVYL